MTLIYQLTTLEGVNEDLHALYTEADGKFTLDVEGVESTEAVNGLKTALVKERENVAKFTKFGTPDEITAKFAEHADALKEAGKGGDKTEQFQAKIKQMETDHTAALAERDGKFTGLQKSISIAGLKVELAKAGVVPEGIDMLAEHTSSRIAFHDDGSPKIMTKDGSMPMIGAGADGGATLADLAKELAEENPFLVSDDGKGGGGKPPESKGGKPGEKKFSEMTSGGLVRLRKENPQEYDRLKAAG